MIVLWNGREVPVNDFRISPFDGGLLRGEGIFETIRASHGRPEFLKRHWQRLSIAAELLGYLAPSLERLEQEIRQVLFGSRLANQDARVRVTLNENLLITAELLQKTPPTARTVISDVSINAESPLSALKSCSYQENSFARQRSKVDEAIRINTRGELCEGCFSNLFWVKDGQVYTPSLQTQCLPGIMRSALLDLESSVTEGEFLADILDEADEIWLTNSLWRLRWVSSHEGREFGEPSERYQILQEGLRTLAAEEGKA